MRRYLSHLFIYGVVCFFIATPCFGQDNQTDNIPIQAKTIVLKYRLADELIPLLKPFLPKTGIITGQGQRILIKTNATNLAEIEQFIRDVDVPLQSLLISVTIDDELVTSEDTRIKRYSTAKRNTAPSTQQVQTLEGQWATVNTGELMPIAQEKRRYGGSVNYRRVSSGFQARARVQGKRVTVELRPKLHSNSRQGGGRINIQQADTTVSGQLGEWIMIGGTDSSTRQKKNVQTYTTKRHDEKQQKIYVRVDVQQ